MHSFDRLSIAALITVLVALVWELGELPRIPIVSEVVGLLAVLIAPGVPAERVLHREGWTVGERLGLVVVLSASASVITGVGLHLASQPVSTSMLLSGIALWTALFLIAPHRPPDRMRGSSRRSVSGERDRTIGLFSIVAMVVAVGIVVFVRPAPAGPALELAVTNPDGTLATLPLRVEADSDEERLRIALRSRIGLTSARLSLAMEGQPPWTQVVGLSTEWAVVEVPIRPLDRGRHTMDLTAIGPSATARLDLELLAS